MDVAVTMVANPTLDVQKLNLASPYQYCSRLKKKGLLQLSVREFECLCLKAIGTSMKQVAKILNLSPRTVESHLYNLKARNNLLTQTDVINFLRKSGLFYEIICYANMILEENL
jgi:DNA-binding CsgD family transcriptional regulator